jgi:diphosphomevalonate decarboxylase
MKASAKANSNIALVKYWGKRDSNLILPYNSSISLTLDGLNAHTTVEFNDSYRDDSLVLNDKEIKPGAEEFDEYIAKFMTYLRSIHKGIPAVKIVSQNNFPTAAGLASSAAGFAALAAAVNQALQLNYSDKDLSILARVGSGSASRSIFGGIVEWQRGELENGSDSYAHQLYDESYWPELRVIICVTDSKEKKIKSRAGMSQTVATSPYYANWLGTIENDIENLKVALKEKSIDKLGNVLEANALKMHATMITTTPSIIYWNASTISIMHEIHALRDKGINAYFTMDAGPQVKVVALEKDVVNIVNSLDKLGAIQKIITAKLGKGYEITTEHLF